MSNHTDLIAAIAAEFDVSVESVKQVFEKYAKKAPKAVKVVKAPAEVPDIATLTVASLPKLTVASLKAFLTGHSVEFASKMKKADLVELATPLVEAHIKENGEPEEPVVVKKPRRQIPAVNVDALPDLFELDEAALTKMTVPSLKALCKKHSVAFKSSIKKADLIELMVESIAAGPDGVAKAAEKKSPKKKVKAKVQVRSVVVEAIDHPKHGEIDFLPAAEVYLNAEGKVFAINVDDELSLIETVAYQKLAMAAIVKAYPDSKFQIVEVADEESDDDDDEEVEDEDDEEVEDEDDEEVEDDSDDEVEDEVEEDSDDEDSDEE